MLRPSRPMIRPLRSSLGRSTTDTVVSIGVLGGAALDGLGDVLLGAIDGRLARFGVEPLQQVGRIVARLAFDLLDQQFLGLVGGEAGDALELVLLLARRARSYLRRGGGRGLLALGSPRGRAPSSSFSSRSIGGLPLGERRFAPRERLFERRRLLALLSRLALGLHQDVVRLLLGVEQRFLLAGLGVALGVLGDAAAPAPRRGRSVSAAMRLRLATQTANTARGHHHGDRPG